MFASGKLIFAVYMGIAVIAFGVMQFLILRVIGKRWVWGLGQAWYFNPQMRAAYKDLQDKIAEASTISRQLKQAAREAGIKEIIPASRSTRRYAYEETPHWGHIRIGEGIVAVEVASMPAGHSDDEFAETRFQYNARRRLGYKVVREEVKMHTGKFVRTGSTVRALREHVFIVGDMTGAHKGLPQPGEVKFADAFAYCRDSKDSLSFAIGQGANAKWKLGQMDECANMLIAGAQGRGKSVFLHNLICTIIRRASAREVKFRLIDLKAAELISYETVPHLLGEIATEEESALEILRAVREESMRRKDIIRSYRNIANYNKHHPADLLDYQILIIDEWADLAQSMDKEIRREAVNLLVKNAKLGRAQGLFTIICTQYPNAEVLTSGVKSQFLARVAFGHATGDDSMITLGRGEGRTIAAATEVRGYRGRCVYSYGIDLDIWQTPLITDDEILESVAIARENAGKVRLLSETTAEIARIVRDKGPDEKGRFVMSIKSLLRDKIPFSDSTIRAAAAEAGAGQFELDGVVYNGTSAVYGVVGLSNSPAFFTPLWGVGCGGENAPFRRVETDHRGKEEEINVA